MAPLSGIDVSRHQGVVDYTAVRRAGHAFAYIKATDGVAYKHIAWFRTNAPKVKASGLILGAYHFLLDHHPGWAQARYYVNEVNKAGGFRGCVPIVDIEREADGTTPRFEHLAGFVAEFRRLVPGRAILIYTGKWYWVGVLGNPPGGPMLGPLWHSEYDGISPISEPVANGPELDNYGGWKSCLVWQHTSSGRCPGVSGNVDLNLFYGPRAVLESLAGVGTPSPVPTPVPPPKEDDMRIIDCAGSPALLVRGDGTYLPLNGPQREAWLAGGVDAHLLTKAQRDVITAAAPKLLPVDVDEAAIAAAVIDAMGDNPDPATAALVQTATETALRRVLLDAGTADGG
jgi:lysozyme